MDIEALDCLTHCRPVIRRRPNRFGFVSSFVQGPRYKIFHGRTHEADRTLQVTQQTATKAEKRARRTSPTGPRIPGRSRRVARRREHRTGALRGGSPCRKISLEIDQRRGIQPRWLTPAIVWTSIRLTAMLTQASPRVMPQIVSDKQTPSGEAA